MQKCTPQHNEARGTAYNIECPTDVIRIASTPERRDDPLICFSLANEAIWNTVILIFVKFSRIFTKSLASIKMSMH